MLRTVLWQILRVSVPARRWNSLIEAAEAAFHSVGLEGTAA